VRCWRGLLSLSHGGIWVPKQARSGLVGALHLRTCGRLSDRTLARRQAPVTMMKTCRGVDGICFILLCQQV
jgi:hypothetical protein